ncbi:MAG: acyl-CoA dehydratase activase [Candidatus Eisenbacteria bacterium]|nr:acyl-CoA dehydratase activase [Candidatus Eisenbacteria bacterium]
MGKALKHKREERREIMTIEDKQKQPPSGARMNAGSEKVCVGIDAGSVSVNIAVVRPDKQVVEDSYVRHKGHPVAATLDALKDLLKKYPPSRIKLVAVTGAAGQLFSDLLNAHFVNEVVAQTAAVVHLHPEVRTVIEIGGEDSKLIFLKEDPRSRRTEMVDFAMNTICAAGTGSFLDQQAHRLDLSIEEFSKLALESKTPPRIAGRCSVFAKSDMIHLQQKGTPPKDIVAGLCIAMARNFKSTVGAARTFVRPISFQGGVAANQGMIRAFTQVLELEQGALIIPKYFASMGAIGAVYNALEQNVETVFPGLQKIEEFLAKQAAGDKDKFLDSLSTAEGGRTLPFGKKGEPKRDTDGKVPAYLGVDVGSISTNVVVMDSEKRVLAKCYLMTASRPIEAVQKGLKIVGDKVGHVVEIRGACTTGSGRYLTGDFIGADLVKNEITAQARAAAEIDSTVDTIFEIGGQDSKYISLENGAIVDFEMNKVCAAGTGSFLEEQAERLGINIIDEFSKMALEAENPVSLGDRCTVFMETELVRHQQGGSDTNSLVAGLSYSIVLNYLNKVVAGKKVGNRIFFQGGVAANRGVVAAFEKITGKPITVPEHHEVTGAIGCAILAMENDAGKGSRFKGFDLSDRPYEVTSFECTDCANRCEINCVKVEGEKPLYYGSRCEKYDVDRGASKGEDLPDLFKERERLLLETYKDSGEKSNDAPKIGMPRSLIFHDLFPLWKAFFSELGCKVILSGTTTKSAIHRGCEGSVVETCFPMKVALGHIMTLVDSKVDYIFLPSVINLPSNDDKFTDSFVCPYIQSLTYTVRGAIDFDSKDSKLLTPHVWLGMGPEHLADAMMDVGKRLGADHRSVKKAALKAWGAYEEFQERCRERGREILSSLREGQKAFVVVSRSYNGCDPGANLEIPRKLRGMGVLPIPMDFLPLDSVKISDQWPNMYWRYGQKILSAAEIIANDPRLTALYITNFGCGPDSFVSRFFRQRMGDKPFLQIEVDEHSADAGIITRCEAFLDSLEGASDRRTAPPWKFETVNISKGNQRIVLIPRMADHAHGIAAAFQACGMPAEVLPEPDDETLHWGRKYTTGKECFPCIVTTGDMVKMAMRPDFDRNKYAFFMGGSGGPCRFGQYNALQRIVLDEIGFEDVPIYAPNQASSFYDDLGLVGRRFLELGWLGIVSIDVLYKWLLETRPYAKDKKLIERVYWQQVEDVCDVIRKNGSRKDILGAIGRSRVAFEKIKVDRSEPRPLIGLVGEIYVRSNDFSNNNLVEQIEGLGGQVLMAPVYEWFLYRNVRRHMRSRLDGDYKLLVKNLLKDYVMRRDEHSLSHPFKGLIETWSEPSSKQVLDMAAPYLHPSFEGEAILTVGKSIDFIKKGLAGVVSAMPFTCMPGTISHAILKFVQKNEGGFPFLNMVYDGTEQANTLTRLQAFMYQAKEYAKRKRDTSQ